MLLKDATVRFEEFYAIYEEAFPPNERRQKEDQKKILQNPSYRVRVAGEGAIAAIAGYWSLPGCLFLEHLATAPHYRGLGLGRKLVKECLEETKLPVFLEIEPVTAADPMSGRRQAFYERLGFWANTFPYLQPPLKEGDQPMPLWIMSHGGPVSQEEFEPFKLEIYRLVYSFGQAAEGCLLDQRLTISQRRD